MFPPRPRAAPGSPDPPPLRALSQDEGGFLWGFLAPQPLPRAAEQELVPVRAAPSCRSLLSTRARPWAEPQDDFPSAPWLWREERREGVWSRWRGTVPLSDPGTWSGAAPCRSQPRMQPAHSTARGEPGFAVPPWKLHWQRVFPKKKKKKTKPDANFIFAFILLRRTTLSGPVSVLSLGGLRVGGCCARIKEHVSCV